MRTLAQTGAGKGGQVRLAILKLDVLQVGLGQQRPGEPRTGDSHAPRTQATQVSVGEAIRLLRRAVG